MRRRTSADSAMSDRAFGVIIAVAVLLALGFMSFAGWMIYLLVMHFTHGGAS